MKILLKIFVHSILMLVLWILSLMIGNSIIPMDVPQPEGNELTGLLFLYTISVVQVLVLHFFIVNTQLSRIQLFWRVLVIFFGIQFFMSQIETLYFIGEEVMSTQSVFSLVLSGFLLAIGYATVVSFTYKTAEVSQIQKLEFNRDFVLKLAVMAVLIYPALYFLAGYYIAWQSGAVRIYYTNSATMNTFWEMTIINIQSGLYTFQMGRTFLWVAIGLSASTALICSQKKSALIVGLLFSVIGSAVLVLPNPIMPEEVRMYHLMETLSSNFIWGAVIGWWFHGQPKLREVG